MDKLSPHELSKLRAKMASKKPIDQRVRDTQRYAKLLLHKHRFSEKTHQINFETGDIVPRVTMEETKV